MLQLKFLLSNNQLLIPLLQLRNVPPNVQQFLQQILVRTSNARQARLVKLFHVLTFSTKHFLELNAASLQILDFQINFILLAFYLLRDA